ncbi:MAG: DUF3575 domain-containing protein [Rikenellaceae bacterium]|nr:DUF3575 domain-containing protein [Rikenellaceae bacterium]
MKKILFCVAVLTAFVTGEMQAQRPTEQITFPARHITIKDAMATIIEQTNYLFAVNHTGFDVERTVTLSDNPLPLTQALDQMFAGSNRAWTIRGSHIILTPVEPAAPAVIRVAPAAPPVVRNDFAGFEDEVRANIMNTRTAGVRRDAIVNVTPHDGRFSYPARTFIPMVTEIRATGVEFSLELPSVLLKTNVLYGVAAAAPNLSLEIGLGHRTSLDLVAGYNGWRREGTDENNSKLAHRIWRTEFRYWLCERFNGHFFGAHAFLWQYNIGGRNIPMLFEREYRYAGRAVGGGVSWGYHWAWNARWGMEFNVGAGVAFMHHDKYECHRCADALGNFRKTYVGPTNVGVKLVYVIK